MSFNPEFDKAGYCTKCHVPIAEFDGANNIVRLLGNSRTMQVRLDDKSLMNINVCELCKDSIKPEDTPDLIDSCIRGWDFECDVLIEKGVVRVDGRKWDKSLKDEHMKVYGTRYIVERTDEIKWSRETIVDAVYAEIIAENEKKLKDKEKDVNDN